MFMMLEEEIENEDNTSEFIFTDVIRKYHDVNIGNWIAYYEKSPIYEYKDSVLYYHNPVTKKLEFVSDTFNSDEALYIANMYYIIFADNQAKLIDSLRDQIFSYPLKGYYLYDWLPNFHYLEDNCIYSDFEGEYYTLDEVHIFNGNVYIYSKYLGHLFVQIRKERIIFTQLLKKKQLRCPNTENAANLIHISSANKNNWIHVIYDPYRNIYHHRKIEEYPDHELYSNKTSKI